MKIKYEATDGTVFLNKESCIEYELKHSKDSNNFTIKFCLGYNSNETVSYCGDGHDFKLEYFIRTVRAFKITKGLENWNGFLNQEFSGLDDETYYHYEIPVVTEEDYNKWLTYDFEGAVRIFDNNYIATLKEYIGKLEKLQEQLD